MLRAGIGTLCILASATVQAQDTTVEDVSSEEPRTQTPKPTADQVQEIVVTANRREENIQKVPIAISAFDGAALARSGISNASDLGTLVPGLVYTSIVGYASPYLRGIGSSATGPGKENPIATYVDGVYLAAQSSAMLSLSNIAGIEVDKGPQGTLFGRNATGGAIQINTLTPSDTPSLTTSLGYGNYDTVEAKLYATTGLAPNLAGDVAVVYFNQGDGYGKNLANGMDVDKTRDYVIRSKLQWLAGDATTITLAGDYGRTDGIPTLAPAPGTIPQFNPPLAPNPRDVYGRPQPYLHIERWGIAGTIEQDLGAASLTSITAYRSTHYDSLFDSTLTAEPGTTFLVAGPEPYKQFSQEFRLTSDDNDRLDWVLGAYYFQERSGYLIPILIGGESLEAVGFPGGILSAQDRKTKSAAAFGQGTYAITDATKMTLGLRYTYEKRTNHYVESYPDAGFDGFEARGKVSFNNVSWRAALSHDFTSRVMGYLSYNRGFKSGLYNTVDAVKPERLDAFEAGLKSALFDSRIRLNLAGFYYLYKNIQASSYPGGQLVLTNGPKATLYGLDGDLEFVVSRDLRLSGGFELLHSNYDLFEDAPISSPVPGGGTVYNAGSAQGNSLARAPKLSANIAVDYSHVFGATKIATNVTYSYNDGWYAEADNRLRQAAYNLLNASLKVGTEDDRFAVKFWGRNLFNEDYAVALGAQTNGDFIQWAQPRTYGATMMTKF